jgi:Homeodomain-like domain
MVCPVLMVLVLWLVATVPRPGRDFEAMEQRRKRAARLFARGVTQAEVARDLAVSRQSVSRWHTDWQAGGTKALKAAGRAGRMPRLSTAQLQRIDLEVSARPRPGRRQPQHEQPSAPGTPCLKCPRTLTLLN